MKIALVSPYDFAYHGGVNNHISALEKQLTRIGHEVKIIAPTSQPVTALGDRFISIGTPKAMPAVGTTIRISISIRLAAQIKKILDREKFDIVHLHEPFMIMLCSSVLRFSKSVNIGTFHATKGLPGYHWGWPINRFLLKRRGRNLAGRIAVSPTAEEYANSFMPAQYEVIPNGIDLEEFNPSVKPIKKYNDGRLNILFVGRLEKRKGLKYLLHAYKEVKEKHAGARLLVVGPGTRYRRKMEQLAQSLKLKDVVFVGAVSNEELPCYYQTADIFCAPATGQESFGIVLLEAMALSKAVVATNIAGYASVVTNGREGLTVPPKKHKPLAQAINSLITDEDLRKELGERGRLTAENYSWDRVAKRVVAFYNSTLHEAEQKDAYNPSGLKQTQC